MLDNLLKKPKDYYKILRKDLINLIPDKVKCLLDVGCGTGKLGAFLKKNRKITVIGIELSSKAGKIARKYLDKVYVGDIEKIKFNFKKNYFDCIVCGDVLEHLIDPVKILIKLKPFLKKDGILIASIPNIQHYTIIYRLIFGKWQYSDAGLLDKTHLRFFTLNTIKELFSETGYKIIRIQRNYLYSKLIIIITLSLIKLFKNFLTLQYIIVARK